jgi:hypothetical protein
MFEKVINKPARLDLMPIRISEQLRLEQMDVQFEKYINEITHLNRIPSKGFVC